MNGIHAYRALLRASHLAFQGDSRMLLASHREIRSQFEQSRLEDNASTASDDSAGGVKGTIDDKIEHAFNVASYLRANVVQGEKTAEEEKYKLRIHSDTEKGDNESIKTPLKGRVSKLQKCS